MVIGFTRYEQAASVKKQVPPQDLLATCVGSGSNLQLYVYIP